MGERPTVTLHVGDELARACRRVLIRRRLGRWIAYATFFAFACVWFVWVDGADAWLSLISIAWMAGFVVYGERTTFRKALDLPVGHDLRAEFGDVALIVRGPERTSEIAYASVRTLQREGPVMRLEDGAGERSYLPSALFSPEHEAWFRHNARARDLTAEPLAPGQRDLTVEPELAHRLALAGVLQRQIRESWLTWIAFVAMVAVLAVWTAPWVGLLLALFVGIGLLIGSVHDYDKSRDRFRFHFAHGPARVGFDGASWVIDGVNHRQRIDPAAITFFERRRGLVLLRHTTYGEKAREVFPEAWVAGLVSPSRDTADAN